jgi:hypothetical protein
MRVIFAIWFLTLGMSETISAQSITRSLAYVVPSSGRWVYVTVSDSPIGPMGMVSSADPRKNENASDLKHTDKLFTMSRAQFDQMWAVITSANNRKYAIAPRARKLDMPNSYVFFVSRKPGRDGTFYVIPRNQASQAVAAAAKQLFRYAK